MRLRFAAVALVLAIAFPALATQANPSQRQRDLIEEIFTLTKPENTARQMIDGMLERVQKQMEREQEESPQSTYEENKKDFDRYRQLINEKLDYKEWVHSIYVPLYAKYFNEQQLAELVAFYKTPTGQRMISVMPEIEREAMRANTDEITKKVGDVLKQVQEERKKRTPWESTMSDMRSAATAIEAYATDVNKYPDAQSWSELGKVLSPTYIKTMPEKDGWGNEYAYVVSADRMNYRVISAGADGTFEWDSRRIVLPPAKPDGKAIEPKASDRLEDDIIFADGSFVQFPRVSHAGD